MFESSSPLFFINLEKIIKLKIALQYYSLFKLCLHGGLFNNQNDGIKNMCHIFACRSFLKLS